tara:strand:- start:14695 stop:15093 length:399 start_codon:yes stop_codon:yes gene_type:complete
MNISHEEDQNSIKFNCSGAIDFTKYINIELSLEEKEGFTGIDPLTLLWKINKIKNMSNIIDSYFYRICGKVPHMSDRNEDLPIERRFTQIFYRSYIKYRHSHEPWGKYTYTPLTLKESIKYIKKENFSIVLP